MGTTGLLRPTRLLHTGRHLPYALRRVMTSALMQNTILYHQNAITRFMICYNGRLAAILAPPRLPARLSDEAAPTV